MVTVEEGKAEWAPRPGTGFCTATWWGPRDEKPVTMRRRRQRVQLGNTGKESRGRNGLPVLKGQKGNHDCPATPGFPAPLWQLPPLAALP